MITEKQYDNMIKAANGSGWINNMLKTKTKEEIMNFVNEKMYFNEVVKKLSMRIYLANSSLYPLGELFTMNEEELFDIVEENEL